MINKHIEIAISRKGKFSSMGLKASSDILALLSEKYEKVNISVLDNISDLQILVRKSPDLVVLGLKRMPNSNDLVDESTTDIWLPEYLDRNGINYTGSSVAATKLDFDKEKAKAQVRLASLPTAKSFISRPDLHKRVDGIPLPFPLFIKPLSSGGGFGVDEASVVRSFSQFQSKVQSVYTRNLCSSIVEQYLDGREFSVAILERLGGNNPLVVPIEIVTAKNSQGDRILGSRIKSEDNEIVKQISDVSLRKAVSSIAFQIYTTLGGRDYGRIDLRMDSLGNLNFLEANFMPAISSRYYTGAFVTNGVLTYEEIVYTLIENAMARNDSLSNTNRLVSGAEDITADNHIAEILVA